MKAHQAEHPVGTQCRVLGISVSGYYAAIAREPSARAREDARLLTLIREAHAESRGTYGARRVHAELVDGGEIVGRDRVSRLMRSAGLEGVSPRKWTVTTRQDDAQGAAPDLVERKFEADAPNKLWVADITYVPTWEGFPAGTYVVHGTSLVGDTRWSGEATTATGAAVEVTLRPTK